MGKSTKIKKRKKKKVILVRSPDNYECSIIDDFDEIPQREQIKLPTDRREYYSLEIEEL